ncbi:MAG: hypothetical protein P9M13_02725 [Candidatus Ancaeobacter aquaticus]|nr:hypothetical protein [Candidatus Ancaeobacter aquaticus]
MSTEHEIIKIEERAQELVSNLEALHQQVGSYQEAKDELQKASVKLLTFIESTQKLSEESHQIIQTINQIGSSKIFERLKNIERMTYILTGAIGIAIVLQVVFFFLKR